MREADEIPAAERIESGRESPGRLLPLLAAQQLVGQAGRPAQVLAIASGPPQERMKEEKTGRTGHGVRRLGFRADNPVTHLSRAFKPTRVVGDPVQLQIKHSRTTVTEIK